jgi:hypothetical protein
MGMIQTLRVLRQRKLSHSLVLRLLEPPYMPGIVIFDQNRDFRVTQTLILDTQQNQEWIQSCFISFSVYTYMCNDNTCETGYRTHHLCRKGRYLGAT